jgi:alkylation response protein AidB-like acyl-CoA dehydrogenase
VLEVAVLNVDGPDGDRAVDLLAKLAADGALDLPLPGRGDTWRRWSALRDWGRQDLVLARLAEGHTDALAILAEAGQAPTGDSLYGVWAARSGPGLVLRDGRLTGTLRFCSGAHDLDRALVVADSDSGPQLVDVGVRGPAVEPVAGSWRPLGMADSDSADVHFDGLVVDGSRLVGEPGFYTERAGFWRGGAGVAAVWLGGAMGVLDDVHDWLREHGSDSHAHAHLGALHVAVEGTEALLRRTACAIDAHPDARHQRAVGTVRASAEHTGRAVLDVAPQLLGATGLCRDERISQRLADLGVYIRQHHGQRDLAALGERLLSERSYR